MSFCVCGKQGYFSFPLSPLTFCSECFTKKFEKRFIKHLPRDIRGNSIAVAFSGGKDSSTLIHILQKYSQKLKIQSLCAISLDEGNPTIQKSRNKIISISEKKYQTVDFIKPSYVDLFGYSLPILVKNSDNKKLGFTPCTICGVLRRHALIKLSLELKIDHVVLGNTLNDEAATTFLNILRGNPDKNLREMISYKASDEALLPKRIKPLAKFFEDSIRKYCDLNNIQPLDIQCNYKDRSLRLDINSFLTQLETKKPGLLHNIVSSGKKSMVNRKILKTVRKCYSCNSYSPNDECSACTLIRKIIS